MIRNSFAYITLLLLLGLSLPLPAQSSHVVHWEANRPLKWSDFRGIPDSEDQLHAASTYAGILLEVTEVAFPSGRLSFRARGLFDTKRSWAFPERSDALVLAHEQRHFDLAEIYARLLEQRLNDLELRVRDKEKAKKLHEAFSRKQRAMQARYDIETAHGLNQKAQQAWNLRIQQALSKPSLAAKLFGHSPSKLLSAK